MPDKRNYLRYSQSGSVNIKMESDTPNIFQGDLIDICFWGFCAYLKKKIEIGVSIQFELRINLMHEPLIGRGKIKSTTDAPRYGVRGFRVGVEFTDVNKKKIEMLINQIQSRISREKIKKSIKGDIPF